MKYKTAIMESLIDDISIGPFGSNVKSDFFVDNGFPFLSGNNIVGFTLNDSELKYIEPERAEKMGRCIAHRGDVIVSYIGTLGESVYVPLNSRYEAYLISQRQFRVKCGDFLCPMFLVLYLHTREGLHQLLSDVSSTGVPTISSPTTNFKKIIIPLPSIREQRAIVGIISHINEKITLNQAINDNLGGACLAS